MAAAITVCRERPEARVVILERLEEPGHKLRATGNGRCNLSNVQCPGFRETLEFFREIGVICRIDGEGRIYPYSEDAGDVTAALQDELSRRGVTVRCGARVTEIAENGSRGFAVRWEQGKRAQSLTCRKVLIAAGGKAAPKLGTTGDGAILARKLGHTVTRLAPALTAVELAEPLPDLSGVRARAWVRLMRGEDLVAETAGELQFTSYGVSGICIFDLSSHLVIPEGKNLKNGFDDYCIWADFTPDIEDLPEVLRKRQKKTGQTGAALIRSLVKAPLAEEISRRAEGDPAAMAELLKAFPLKPSGVRGWDHAQVTRGGVELTEINEETMESKLVPGLYLAGEVLDYAGPCGGFNLQYAWETGIKAGKGMTNE